MNLDSIELDNLTKKFEFFKISTEIDSIDDIDEIKNIAKCYCKLYFKQQEVVSKFGNL